MPTYTNLFTNPQPATPTPGWSLTVGTGGTASASILSDAGGPAGEFARRVTWSVGSTGGVSGQIFGAATTLPVSANTPYSIACYIRLSAAKDVTPRIQWVDSGGASLAIIVGDPISVEADVWTEIKYENQTSHASAAFARGSVVSISGEGWETGFLMDMQAGTLIEGATIPEPFHGDLTDTGTHVYSWTGTPDQSTSTLVVTAGGLTEDPADSLGVRDVLPLLPPEGGAADVLSSTEIDLSWHLLAGADSYDVERDAAVIATGQTGATFSDTGLTAETLYSYRFRSRRTTSG